MFNCYQQRIRGASILKNKEFLDSIDLKFVTGQYENSFADE